ncbi:MAG: HAMP domain-containing histidine kinase, partial [Patescibacteria group bacterium]|nr:HAMP domain-containing histidine kinase [Patescibacteria group bacterium]
NMERLSKQSAASATDSGHSVFFWARLKLTGLYVLIVAVIVVGFSRFLYQNLQRSLYEANDSDFADTGSQQHFIEHTLTSFENDIFIVDIIILLCTGALGYVFAGYTLRPIQQSLEAQQAFSEKASHELRTPLTVMRNEFEVLMRNPSLSKELMHSALKSGVEEIDRLSGMTKDLLTLARSRTRSVASSEQFDLAQLARATADRIRRLSDEKGVVLTISAEEPISVLGWPGELARAITNLLQNAIEHTPKGGSIALEAKREGHNAVVRVSDTGSGIDSNDLPHVFERFYKGEGTNGSGLGLSIVKELIVQHGGSVHIESEREKGTKATITLPLSS